MALGRGLGEILEEVGQAYEVELQNDTGLTEADMAEQVQELPLDRIDPNPYQPRKHFDEARLEELAASIQEHGLLQPVVVVPRGDRYLLVAGERRLRAHKLAGLSTIRAIVADVDFDELRMRELALIENIQRENLNTIELATSYQELLDVHQITHEGLAQIVHKSRPQITNTLRMLSLSPHTQQMLIEEKITQGHAKLLVGLPAEKERVLVDTIIGQKLSVRDTERLLQKRKKPMPPSTTRIQFDPALLAKLKRVLPLRHTVKADRLEIVLPNEEALIQFITLLEKK